MSGLIGGLTTLIVIFKGVHKYFVSTERNGAEDNNKYKYGFGGGEVMGCVFFN